MYKQSKKLSSDKIQEIEDRKKAKQEFLRGLPGKDGIDGKDIKASDIVSALKGPKGDPGMNGADGVDGKDGKNGIDGKPGQDGEIGPRGPQGPPGPKGDKGNPGADGEDGQDGVGIQNVRIVRNDLIITFTTGEQRNVGRVVGERGPIGPRGQSGVSLGDTINQGDGQTDLQVITESEGGNSSGSYTSDKLTLITFEDTDKYTNNTKTLNYTGDEMTQTVNVFDYEGQTWTVTRDYTYLAGVWQTKSINIVKV